MFATIEGLLAAIETGGENTPKKETVETEIKRLGFDAIIRVKEELELVLKDGEPLSEYSIWMMPDTICRVPPGLYAASFNYSDAPAPLKDTFIASADLTLWQMFDTDELKALSKGRHIEILFGNLEPSGDT